MRQALVNEDYKIWFEHITMAFPGVLALDDVSFGIKKGTVHIMMGENGAGKSTLMKILNGSYIQTDGKVMISGKEARFKSALDAEANGVAMIYQEVQYLPDFTVEKYLMMCREPRKLGFINWRAVTKEAEKILKDEDLQYDPKETMRNLTVSDIQLLEITRAIKANKVDILIMDEPTSALSNAEVDRLFANIQKLKERGITIIYISHKMDEIFRIADYITVMRDGKHIETAPAADFTNESLVKMMVGRELSNTYPKEHVEPGNVVLEVEGLTSSYNKLKDVSFKVRKGEILGLGGLMGAGRTETVRCIFGLDPFEAGRVKVDGREVHIRNVEDAVRSGIAMASEDRRRFGLIMCRDIRENISISSLKKVSALHFLNKKKEKNMVAAFFGQLKIKAPGDEMIVQNLSGGNQQKVVLAKWLMSDPKVLILDEPTRGIDVGAKYEIYKLMVELAKQGIAIVMISSELPEFIGMCDRAYVMYGGRITGELTREEMTQENIVMLSTGGEHETN